MSYIGSMLGIGDNNGAGGAGLNFQAQSTPLIQPTNAAQASAAYNQSQHALQTQRDFLNAVNGANGVGNQSQVFNQLQGVANGTGPNPAQNMLNQETGKNVANQAALMASARGASANPGLIARQAAQQGAQIQQSSIGQGATLQAQQQLGAIGQAGQIANQQAAQQAGAVNSYNQAAQNEQGNILNALNQQNNQNVNMQSNINSANAGVGQIAAKGQQDTLGGLINGVSTAAAALAHGGVVPQKMADGGLAMPMSGAPTLLGVDTAIPVTGPQSFAGQYLFGAKQMSSPQQSAPITPASTGAQASAMENAGKGMGQMAVKGGQAIAGLFNKGGSVGTKLKAGGKVPGNAKVPGDNLKNDTVAAKLSPGEIVIPRSVINSSDPVGNTAKFVQAIMGQHGLRKSA